MVSDVLQASQISMNTTVESSRGGTATSLQLVYDPYGRVGKSTCNGNKYTADGCNYQESERQNLFFRHQTKLDSHELGNFPSAVGWANMRYALASTDVPRAIIHSRFVASCKKNVAHMDANFVSCEDRIRDGQQCSLRTEERLTHFLLVSNFSPSSISQL